MTDEVLKGFLRIGVLVGGCAFVLIFLQPPGSAEFVLSVCSALIGVTLVVAVVVVNRYVKR
jgi:hypothetical protein